MENSITDSGQLKQFPDTKVAEESGRFTVRMEVTYTRQPESCMGNLTDNSGGECRYNYNAPAKTEVTKSS